MMNFTFIPIVVGISLFVGMLLFYVMGRRLGFRHFNKDAETDGKPSAGTIEAAIFALFGLLIAFTFSGAASRFDDRRHLIAEETNAIGTAYLRLDIVDADARAELRALFRRYTDSRLEYYKRLPDVEAAQHEWNNSMSLQNTIWTQALAACRTQTVPSACVVLLPALNAMIDITTTRKMAMMMHPPQIIFVLLFVFAYGCSFIAGYGTARNPSHRWVHPMVFATMTAIAVYVIVDIEYPRFGVIRVDAADQILIELRDSMNRKAE
jgi:hypothetical protein